MSEQYTVICRQRDHAAPRGGVVGWLGRLARRLSAGCRGALVLSGAGMRPRVAIDRALRAVHDEHEHLSRALSAGRRLAQSEWGAMIVLGPDTADGWRAACALADEIRRRFGYTREQGLLMAVVAVEAGLSAFDAARLYELWYLGYRPMAPVSPVAAAAVLMEVPADVLRQVGKIVWGVGLTSDGRRQRAAARAAAGEMPPPAERGGDRRGLQVRLASRMNPAGPGEV